MAYPSTPEPDHIENTKREYLFDEQTAEDGTRYVYLRRDQLLQEWKLTYEALSESDQITLDAWLDSTAYGFGSDTWTHPVTGASHTVVLAKGSFKVSIVAYKIRKYELTLQEVP